MAFQLCQVGPLDLLNEVSLITEFSAWCILKLFCSMFRSKLYIGYSGEVVYYIPAVL